MHWKKRTRCCERDGWSELSPEKLHWMSEGKEWAGRVGTARVKDQGQEDVNAAGAHEALWGGTLLWLLHLEWTGTEAGGTRELTTVVIQVLRKMRVAWTTEIIEEMDREGKFKTYFGGRFDLL